MSPSKEKQGQEQQAKFRDEVPSERCPEDTRAELPPWSSGEKASSGETGSMGVGAA